MTRFRIRVLFALLAAISPATAAADTPPATPGPNASHVPRETWHPQELWRRGGADDDLLYGFIIAAQADAQGRTYLLDRWLATVQVIGPVGESLPGFGREGEGPGETTQPTDLTWLPGGEIGIVQPVPARIVRFDRDGTPRGEIAPGSLAARETQFGILTEARWRGGTLACNGSRSSFRDGRQVSDRFLFTCDAVTGADRSRIFEQHRVDDGRAPQREVNWYWVHEGRWDVGPDGRIYAAPRRDEYRVEVYAPDGRLERVVTREFSSWRRTDAEKDAQRKRHTRPEGEWGGGREVRIEEAEPCVKELHVTEAGDLWVRHSRSDREQAAGIFAVWDVFDRNGVHVREVAIEVPGDPRADRLLLLADGRLLMVRGYWAASDAMWAGGSPGDGDEPGEIICYGAHP